MMSEGKDTNEFGRLLRNIRHLNGLSQKAFAQECRFISSDHGYSATLVALLEGGRRSPTRMFIFAVAYGFQLGETEIEELLVAAKKEPLTEDDRDFWTMRVLEDAIRQIVRQKPPHLRLRYAKYLVKILELVEARRALFEG